MMTSHSDCPVCDRVGAVVSNHFVTCQAYRALVHIEHCLQCRYHRMQCSIDWCTYKTREQKIKERKG